MKPLTKKLFVLAAAVCLPLFSLHAEYTAPTEGKLDQLLANPKLINSIMQDATGKDASELILRIIGRIQEAELDANQTIYQISFFTARITGLLSSEQAQLMASELIPQVPANAIIAVLTGMSYGGGGSNNFINHIKELTTNQQQLDAVTSPRSAMTNPVHNRLVATLGTTNSLPPSVVDSLPPPIPVGSQEAVITPQDEPPPVAPTYDGQG